MCVVFEINDRHFVLRGKLIQSKNIVFKVASEFQFGCYNGIIQILVKFAKSCVVNDFLGEKICWDFVLHKILKEFKFLESLFFSEFYALVLDHLEECIGFLPCTP